MADDLTAWFRARDLPWSSNGGDQARVNRPSITAAVSGPGQTRYSMAWSWRSSRLTDRLL
jgi:hypothetical protein